MYDARVVRGSTYAARILSQAQQEDEARLQHERQVRASRRLRTKKKPARPKTPEPVPGRKHIDVQTDDYLEELTDRPPERDQEAAVRERRVDAALPRARLRRVRTIERGCGGGVRRRFSEPRVRCVVELSPART